MFYLVKFIFFIFLYIGTSSLLFSAKIKIYNIGQGNGVILKHKNPSRGTQVIIIDAGSSALLHNVQNIYDKPEEEFPITNKKRSLSPQSSEDDQKGVFFQYSQEEEEKEKSHPSELRSVKDPGAFADDRLFSEGEISIPSDSAQLVLSRNSSGPGSSPESLPVGGDVGTQSYKKSIIEEMKSFIWEDRTEEDSLSITFIGTHSDSDHVDNIYLEALLLNPLREGMTTDTEEHDGASAPMEQKHSGSSPIKNIILGGFLSDYSKEIQITLEALKKLGTTVIFTGTYDGQGIIPNERDGERARSTKWGEGENGYARPYSSFFPSEKRSPVEDQIERALNFGEDLTVKILAMNSGFAMEHERVRIVNEDPNVNSMVLHFQVKDGYSFMVTGDAENPTWNFIDLANKVYNGGNPIPTDYFLVSHHGSKEKEATEVDILRLFMPKAFIISTGARYHHPSSATVEKLSTYLKDKFSTQAHDITYFDLEKKYKRRTTKAPIFSTLTNGNISFTLDPSGSASEDFPIIYASHRKVPIFETRTSDLSESAEAVDGSPSIRKLITQDFERFSSEQDMITKLRNLKETGVIKRDASNVWEDNGERDKKTRGLLKKTNQNIGVKEISPEDKLTFFGASPPAGAAPLVDIDFSENSDERHIIFRKKDIDGVDKWILYFALPGEEDASL